MSAIFRASLRIPQHERPALAEAIDRTRNQFQFSAIDLALMFRVYNEYLAQPNEPENINCGGCRTRVIGWLRTAVSEWHANGILKNGNNPD